MKAKFHLAVKDLADDITDLLRKLDGVLSAAPEAGADAAATVASAAVYLAECSYDRREDRKALNAELRARKAKCCRTAKCRATRPNIAPRWRAC